MSDNLHVLIDKTSVSRTVDAINAALFEGRPVAAEDRENAGRWLAARQGQPGAYAEMFAGFPSERTKGIVLFTGERITSASARHILGEEASRVLRMLRVRDAGARAALQRATGGMLRCLERAADHPRFVNSGQFCCGKCTVGLWRNLLAGGLDRQEERLRRGVGYLRSMRHGNGGWRTFPFWYTVLALADMDFPDASKEIRYAAPALERAAARAPGRTVYAARRHQLAERALSRVSLWSR